MYRLTIEVNVKRVYILCGVIVVLSSFQSFKAQAKDRDVVVSGILRGKRVKSLCAYLC
jgi:hypothetical protein